MSLNVPDIHNVVQSIIRKGDKFSSPIITFIISMNVKNLLKNAFKRFARIENGAIIKIKKKRQKKNNAAVNEKGEVKLKKNQKPRRRKNYKVCSAKYVDTDEDSVEEEEPVNAEVAMKNTEPVEKERKPRRINVQKVTCENDLGR